MGSSSRRFRAAAFRVGAEGGGMKPHLKKGKVVEQRNMCGCRTEYSIEPHGPSGWYALYHGRCPHFHGLNLCALSDFDSNRDKTIEAIVNALNGRG